MYARRGVGGSSIYSGLIYIYSGCGVRESIRVCDCNTCGHIAM